MSDYATERLYQSTVPKVCSENGCPVMLGIDEAGRGPVLGPMTYGAAYWPVDANGDAKKQTYDDSKALTSEKRESLFENIKNDTEMGWVVRVISAKEISANMLSHQINLNEISRNAAIELINTIRNQGVNVTEVYVDTVGDPEKYEAFLTRRFNCQIKFTVRKKADSLFKVVSAGSICAKVIRDDIIEKWTWDEQNVTLSTEFGSGYPSDPTTKKWLEQNIDPFFVFPTIARFSWGTVERVAEKSNCIPIHWEDEDAAKENTPSITSFFQSKDKPKAASKSSLNPPPSTFFKSRGLTHVAQF